MDALFGLFLVYGLISGLRSSLEKTIAGMFGLLAAVIFSAKWVPVLITKFANLPGSPRMWEVLLYPIAAFAVWMGIKLFMMMLSLMLHVTFEGMLSRFISSVLGCGKAVLAFMILIHWLLLLPTNYIERSLSSNESLLGPKIQKLEKSTQTIWDHFS